MKLMTVRSIVFLLCIACLTSCNPRLKDAEVKTTKTTEETEEINLFLYGSPDKMNRVLDEYIRKYEPDYEIHATFLADIEDYQRLLQLKLASLEDIDLVYDSPSIGMQDNIIQDRYKVLTDYFHNEDYPGMKENFPESMMEYNLFLHRIYGIPLFESADNIKGVFIRRDLRESLGYPEISSQEELLGFWEYIQENTDMIPLAIGAQGLESVSFDFPAWMNDEVYQVPGLPWTKFPVLVRLTEEKNQIKTVYFLGDEEEQEDNGILSTDYFSGEYEKFLLWKKYNQDNSVVNIDALSYMIEGKAVCSTESFSQYEELKQQLSQSVPEAVIEFFPLSIEDQKDGTEKQVSGMAEGFWAIPVHSEKHNLVMEMIEQIYADEELRKLVPSPVQPSQNPPVNLTPLSGFTFNPMNVPVELEQLTLLYKKYGLILSHGAQENTKEYIEEFYLVPGVK